jgi:nucleoid-associated protein YgaU
MAKGGLVVQTRRYFKNFNWQESYASLVLGAIIVIILGLLVANYFTRRNQQQIETGEQTTQAEQQTQQAQQGYKVVEGDSLSKISEKTYGSQDFWPVLAQVNNITNPNLIFVDATLKLPSKTDVETMKTEMTVTSYQVQQGDTLFSIAQKVYGDGSKWPTLDKANGVGRLANGNPLIFAGNTLIIPR